MIRLAEESDAAAVRAIYAPFVENTCVSFEEEPPTESEMARRIADTLPRHPWLVLDDNGTVVGYAYASPHRARAAYRWSVDVSVYVHPARHRTGAGRALYTALLDLLTRQGYRNAYAGIALPNAASVGLHEALGFTPVGIYREVGYKFGRWHDVGWWQRTLRSPESEGTIPSEPLTVREGPGDLYRPAPL